MNQIRTVYAPLSRAPRPPQPRDAIDVDRLLWAARRALPVVACAVFAALAVAILYLAIADRTYVSSAKILLGGTATQLVPEVSPLPARMTTDAEILSQIEILQSSELAAQVVDRLGLAGNAAFINQRQPLAGRIKRWIKVRLGMEPAVEGPPMEVLTAQARRGYAVSLLQRNLSVSRAGRSHAIDIRYRSASPDRARAIAAAYTEAYLSDQVSAGAQANMQAALWLQNRLIDIGDRLAKSDRELERARSERRPTDTDEAAIVELRQLEQRSDALRTLYNTFLMRSQEVEQQQGFPVTGVRVISAATAPGAPATPQTLPVLALALFAGVALGGLVAALRALRDGFFFLTGEDVEAALGLPFLGYLPRREPGWGDGEPLGAALEAEMLAAARRAVDLCAGGAQHGGAAPKVVGVLSALPEEQRAGFARRFADFLAGSGARVTLFDVSAAAPGAASPPEAVRVEPDPAAISALVHEPGGPDYAIVLLPPLAVSRAALTALPALSAAVFVIARGRTRRALVSRALEAIPDGAVPLAGAVLSGADARRLVRGLRPEIKRYLRGLASASREQRDSRADCGGEGTDKRNRRT